MKEWIKKGIWTLIDNGDDVLLCRGEEFPDRLSNQKVKELLALLNERGTDAQDTKDLIYVLDMKEKSLLAATNTEQK